MKTIVIEDKQRIESIILQADACFVGITDLEGNPYVVPMNFGYENDTLYLHSGPEGGKIEMLQRNNNVCITFSLGHKLVYQHKQVACSYSMRSESAMCRGKVEFIEDMEEKTSCTGHYHAPLHKGSVQLFRSCRTECQSMESTCRSDDRKSFRSAGRRKAMRCTNLMESPAKSCIFMML